MSFLFALEVEIIPTLGYTNYFYFSKRIYKASDEKERSVHKNIDLSALSIGLDVVIIDTSCFTFFFNNHVSFLESSKEYGNVDIVRRRGNSVVEEVLYDASLNAGYTFFIESFRIGLGAGMGLFAGSVGVEENSPFALGFVINANADYFLTKSFALSLGIEDGIYGSVKPKRRDEKLKMYNRFCTRIGCVINF